MVSPATACIYLILASITAAGAFFPPAVEAQELIPRAFAANAPHGYTPQTGPCPANTPKIRDASSLSPNESSWLSVRRNATVAPMQELLGRMKITAFDADSYITKYKDNATALPNIGIAISGGGYRAMMNGAGVLEAFDSRTPNSTASGQLGGLLQSATYLTALSGGGWLVGSLYSNNFTSVAEILAQDTSSTSSGDVWQLDNSIFEGPNSGGIQLIDSTSYYTSLIDDVQDKVSAGFNTTITDYWGRALSFQLVNASQGGPAYTFSSIAEQSWFTDGSVPMPILVSDERFPGQTIVSSDSTVFEFSPWELGSQDPTLFGFAPLKYVGTNFSSGSPATQHCVTGYDNVGFVMGTSSSLFNAIVTAENSTQTDTTGVFSPVVEAALKALIDAVGSANEDIADWVNPFYGWNNGSNPNAADPQLTLTDGGEDDQNIPLHPLIQPNRHVDVVFAVDSSADTNATFPTSSSSENWPAGISLIATYERSLSTIQNGTAFPSIPDTNTFFNEGLNNRPTFFGCNASNITAGPTPLIVYLPNGPYSFNSNTSTYDMQYNDTERNAIILNGYNLATQGNSTLDSEWTACVGCAILSRSLVRTGTTVPDVCTKCFEKYCWDGTTNNTAPASFVPTLKLKDTTSVKNAGASLKHAGLWTVAWAVMLVLSLFVW